MLKKNKFKIIASSLLTLSPALFGIIMWKKLPPSMITHWGGDGVADGISSKAAAVFILPAVLLAIHLLGLFITFHDKKQQNQSRKALNIIFWIIPTLSVFSNAVFYTIAFGKSFSPVMSLIHILLGIMFIVIGNYLPKTKQNHTLGIKISWTLNNEENWNKTHRFAGKVWVAGGFIILFSSFLPSKYSIGIISLSIILLVLIPILYSYLIYRKDRKNGIEYSASEKSKAEKIIILVSTVFVAVILSFGALITFTGNITVKQSDNEMTIKATYFYSSRLLYDEIDSVELLDSFDVGIRTNGLGSPRLSAGAFRNDKLGDYTLYSYTKSSKYILIQSNKKSLVVGLDTAEKTTELYNDLLNRLPQ